MKSTNALKEKALAQSTSRESPSEYRSKPPPCDRCDSIGALIVSVKTVVDGQPVRYTAAARCNCEWGRRRSNLVLYDELPGTSREDDHESLYLAEVSMWQGKEAADKLRDLIAKAKQAGKKAEKPDPVAAVKSVFDGPPPF